MCSFHFSQAKHAPRSIIGWFACYAAALLATSSSMAQETPPLSSDATLSSLTAGSTSLSPAFSPLSGTYTANVANAVAGIRITPTTASEAATVTINGTAVASGTASDPITLNVGPNIITTAVTAENGTNTRSYTITVNRASAAVVATAPAVVIDSSRATLNGTANPNGVATVYFEYGPTQEYGSRTPDRDISGSLSRNFAAGITGLNGATTYHFRAVLVNAAGTIYGGNRQFTTVPNPPVAATGAPANVTSSTATLVGAVNPNGVRATVYFEYGLTTAYGQTTALQSVTAGFDTVGVQAPNVPLIAGATYNYRLVASNSAGTAFGTNVKFTVQEGGGTGSGVPTAAPEVVTGSPLSIGTETVILEGTVNPNSGTTLVQFEYGLTESYGMSTAPQGVGNGDTPVVVAAALQGLLPGTTYYYRLTASNNLGKTVGEGAVFTAEFPPPTAVTGDSGVLTNTSVNISGEVRARGISVEAWIDYGTDGITFNSVRAVPETVTGDTSTRVDGELRDLIQGVTYYYRVRAIGSNGQAVGAMKTLDVESLSGLIQQFPPGVPASERQGSVNVTLAPEGIGSGWRFAGEQFWRESGVSATGLTTGDRVIEYRPVPGYLQPASEAVTVISGPAPLSLTRTYAVTEDMTSGSLTVVLKPQDLTEGEAPARWRFFGEGDEDWKESGITVDGLVPGSYVILSKPVAGRSTPTPVTAVVADGETTTLTITYYIADEAIGEAPSMLPFETVSSDTSLPNAFVGQIRGDAGSGTGFVVRPKVVATVGHVVFNDGTLATTTGLQWLFQNDRDVHDPVPLIPRGSYLMTGYAAQRAVDNSPGVSSQESQNLDVATMFFLQDVGRGGFSGYLASDTSINEFLVSDSLKTLAAYPVDGIPEADLDRLHATPPMNVLFSKAFGRTYITQDIRASGGASGGPLCVVAGNGAYYPAAIYLGGTGQTVVRAIDSDVTALIGFADASSGDGVGVNGGSQTNTVTEIYENPDLGALRVIIEPAAARAAGAGWRISNQSPYLPSGGQLDDLVPNAYQISFPALAGFVPPAIQPVTVEAGTLTTITFTYEQIVVAPAITSDPAVTASRGEGFIYQIIADNSPALFTLRGLLPAGLAFDPVSGLISGIPQEAGVFTVSIGASNSGGADTRELTITLLPVLEDQALTVPYLQPMSYAILSSENGGGLSWTASGLPAGLVINPNTGVVSGTPQVPGVYQISVSVTRLGATSQAVLSITVTGIPPQITVQPVAELAIQYGATTTLTVEATGLPEPDLQWYEGASGDTSNPVEDAASPVFTTPVLFQNTQFWVRASSLSGIADSDTSLITILPSSNANLIGLFTSEGPVSPAFNFGVTSYFLTVPNEALAIQLTPLVEVAQSTVRIGETVVPTDSPSDPIDLAVGINTIFVDVTSGDGSTVKRYTLTVTRALPPSVSTGIATNVTSSGVTLQGTATPNGPGTVFFQYGTSTAYGSATPVQEISGTSALEISAALSGLRPELTYHYRIGLTTGAGTVFGDDMTFTTIKSPPLVATGQPIDIETGVVKLIGAVAPNGTPTTVFFEYGIAGESGDPPSTTPSVVAEGSDVVDVDFTLDGLIAGTPYFVRLVGTSAAGNATGEDVFFIVGNAVGLTGTPDAAPEVTTLDALDVTAASAVFQGTVNPQGGTTFVFFEYGTSPVYGQSTPARGIGNGSVDALVAQATSGLLVGTTYHYRLVASNSLGTSYGEDHTFQTGFSNPLAKTGAASPLANGLVRVAGSVRTLGGSVDAFFEYGTDGITFPNRLSSAGGTVSGDGEISVTADLSNLQQGVTYYYRALAVRTDDPLSQGLGEARTFSGDAIAGLIQKFPRELDTNEYQGEVRVNLLPEGLGAWRFVGENYWRDSGTSATGLDTGDREIEFLPVAGYLQPAREPVGVISGAAALVLEREYFQSATPASASLQVFLEPSNRTTVTPTSNRIQWRIARMPETAWKNSGDEVAGLMAGSYLIEFRAVFGLDAPAPATVVVANGEARVADFAYKPNLEVLPSLMRFLSFDEISTTRNLPYAYVGHLRTDAGYHSGFVVKQRVVATTAQAVFDEVTLSQIPGMQWMFQRDREVHEPKPLVPRGFYVFGGYAAQREADNTPGTPSIASQGLNAAAVYFLGDAGRGGFSGFLATDESNQPLLDSTSLKILSGFPVRGGSSTSNFGRMQTTRAVIGSFNSKSATVYASPDMRGLTGMPGGPICIQRDGGSYYPVGIYLGGTTSENLYRVIDNNVIDLFSRAELTANTGENNTSGGISQTSYTAVSTTSTRGSLTVILDPVEARDAGALWKLGSDASYVISGTRKNSLTPGDYIVQFRPVPGFQVPADQIVSVFANTLTTVTLTYLPELSELATWREENFGTTSNEGLASDSEDVDGDGILNIDEYIAGTDPLDPNDFFKVASTQLSSGSFSAEVQGRAGRIYTLQWSGNLEPDKWIDVASAGPLEADGPVTLSDPEAPANRAFYRVGVGLAGP